MPDIISMEDVILYDGINRTDKKYVKEIEENILKNGWVGSPIFVYKNILLTGSHRRQALENIEHKANNDLLTEGEYLIYEELEKSDSVALDVADVATDELEEDLNNGFLDFASIGRYFVGTELERWKDEIEEW